MSLLEKLPHECTIQKRVAVKDGQGLGGVRDTLTEVSTGVECWEQQASDAEARDYQKRDMRITRKVYFVTDPGLTTRHQIVITKRNGTAVAAANQIALDVKSEPRPDSSAGLGILYKVMCDDHTGER